MSNRLRFRVWDTKDKEYLDSNYFEVFCLLPDGSPHVGMTIYNGICDEYQAIPPKQLIVEQCTGLRDKNGVLIYEGDVVLCGILGDRGHTVEAVIDCVYPFDDTIEWRCMYIDSTGVSKSKGQSLHAELCTVISNIHDREVEDE
jgi:uncharacterized phage protein (TIGR01671 family)